MRSHSPADQGFQRIVTVIPMMHRYAAHWYYQLWLTSWFDYRRPFTLIDPKTCDELVLNLWYGPRFGTVALVPISQAGCMKSRFNSSAENLNHRLYLFDAPFDHASLQRKYRCAVPLAAVIQFLAVGKVLVPIAKYEKKDYKMSVDLVL